MALDGWFYFYVVPLMQLYCSYTDHVIMSMYVAITIGLVAVAHNSNTILSSAILGRDQTMPSKCVILPKVP